MFSAHTYLRTLKLYATMKKYLFLVVALFALNSASAQLFSNHREFNTFATSYERWNGIVLLAPKGYTDAGHDPFLWGPKSEIEGRTSRAANYYRMRLKSPDGSVMIIYPAEFYFGVDSTDPDNQYNGVADYLVSAKGYNFTQSAPDKTFGRIYTVLPEEAKNDWVKYEGKNARKWFAAERVYVAHFALPKPFDGKYTHAMVVTMHNTGRRTYEVVCFMTSDDESLREQLFEELKGTIKLYDTSDKTYMHNYRGRQEVMLEFGNNFDFRYLPQPVSEFDMHAIKNLMQDGKVRNLENIGK